MAKEIINIGTSPNKGDGDPVRTAFDKINRNFNELYAGNFADPENIGVTFKPDQDGRVDLGSSDRRWGDLHVKDFIYIGGVRLSVDADNNLVIGGGAISKADVQGDIFADDSTKVFDSATNTFSGKFDGELTGSVYADDSTVLIDGIAGTISASALTGALPAIDGSALTGVSASSIAFANITGTPTTIAGYGITDAFDGAFGSLSGTPTTIAGYGITDAVSTASPAFTGTVDFTGATSVDFTGATITGTSFLTSYTETDPVVGAITGIVKADGAGNISAAVAGTDYLTTVAFADLTGKPTTLAGYGITDAVAISGGNISLADDEKLIFGTDDDLEIHHTGGVNYIAGAGGTIITGNWLYLRKPGTTENYLVCKGDGAVEVYYDNVKKFATSEAGIQIEQGVEEKFATTNAATGVTALDCATGHVHYLTSPAGDVTANFTNLNLTAEYATNLTVIINQGATPYEVTAVQIGGAAQTINWQGGSAPTGNANGIDSFSFTILNDGGSYVVLGQMVDFT